MGGELINRLNESGEIIGITDKTLAHRMGIWHNAIHVWLINSKNQVLIQKRSGAKTFYPNYWDASFGAHIGVYESSEECLIRRCGEELGHRIKSSNVNLVLSYKEKVVYQGMYNYEFVDVYVVREDVEIRQLTPQDFEVSNIKFVPLSTLVSMMKNNDPLLFPHKIEYDFLINYFKNMR